MSNSREKILSKVRQALTSKVPVPFDKPIISDSIFPAPTQDLEIEFAENFTKLQGKFIFCNTMDELVENLNALVSSRKWESIFCNEGLLSIKLQNAGFSNFQKLDLNTCNASITSCESLIARTGSILLSSAQESGRTVSVYAPVHICVAFTKQLVYDIKEALSLINTNFKGNLPSLITLATGPSRTADIEKTLVVGVHGPKEVFCFLVDE